MTVPQRFWSIHLAGEIHSDWRDAIRTGCAEASLPVVFTAQVTDHAASDDCADNILGAQPDGFWKDHASAKINAIRTRSGIERADIVVVRFGEQYKQWNAAFDAGYAAALGKPLVVLHPEEYVHALKEVDAAAMAVCREPSEVVELLRYVISQT